MTCLTKLGLINTINPYTPIKAKNIKSPMNLVASIDKKIRDELGISDTLIRLSIGIEDILDLKKSLDDALKNI